jgi:glucosylglycerate synthase
MATSSEIASVANGTQAVAAADLLIAAAGPVDGEALRQRVIPAVRAFGAYEPGELRIAVASPVASVAEGSVVESLAGLQFLNYPLAASATPSLPWLAAPAAYREIARLAEKIGAQTCLIFGQDLSALDEANVAALARPLLEAKALVSAPLYPTGKFEGLLNGGILYPLTRALYGKAVRHPFAVDFGIAGAMISRLGFDARRGTAGVILCPIVDGAVADLAIAQSHIDATHLTQSEGVDLSTVLGQLAGCAFEDAEKNAAVWQRVRGSQATTVYGSASTAAPDGANVDVRPLIESFQIGFRNLQEIWGLVLPPVTLLELKRLSRLPAEQFQMPDALWAKVIYDFALAHRLRSISRSHLLGALTPLYLGWVASYAAEVQGADAAAAEQRIERLAVAFEAAKPYFVSRWRWPDRFNP